MSTPSTAKQRLGAALTAMRDAAGRPTYKTLVARADKEHGVALSDTALSEWFHGRSVPGDDKRFITLVTLLTGAVPNADLRRLHREAWQHSIRRRGTRRAASEKQSAPRRGGSWVPRLMEVHYVNLERIAELVLSRSDTARLPPIPAGTDPTVDFVETRQALIRALGGLDLLAKRFTADFSLRALDAGDLFVFDTWLRTRNGVRPDDPIRLTGDLNKDPHVYLQRQGVRIVMPLDPKWITTGTAYGEFGSGGVPLAGVCVIKGRVHPGDAKLMPATSKLLYRASPLVLGIPDPFHREADLRRGPLVEVIDPDTDSLATYGPWEWVGSSD
ncbi:hypothetical protein [Mycolicibacterium sp. XJ775]